jgi:DNA-binding transcriptional ArsR family regulator
MNMEKKSTKSGTSPNVQALRTSAKEVCTLLKVLANRDRLLILNQLLDGEKNVRELEGLLGIRQPTLSQQLTILRAEDLVETERRGKYIYYSLDSFKVTEILLTLHRLCTDRDKKKTRRKV